MSHRQQMQAEGLGMRLLQTYCHLLAAPLQGFPWDRHAPAWLQEPGWSPALPGEHWRRTYEMDI